MDFQNFTDFKNNILIGLIKYLFRQYWPVFEAANNYIKFRSHCGIQCLSNLPKVYHRYDLGKGLHSLQYWIYWEEEKVNFGDFRLETPKFIYF